MKKRHCWLVVPLKFDLLQVNRAALGCRRRRSGTWSLKIHVALLYFRTLPDSSRPGGWQPLTERDARERGRGRGGFRKPRTGTNSRGGVRR
ncbi:hypothetical protein Mapa_002822 [Marchantia paleacea]|nr:hypothetical protein Mapa_002822 [Marchantia paleacea]